MKKMKELSRLKWYVFYIAVLIPISLIGCKKLVEVKDPITSTNTTNVYNSDANAAAVLTGIYSRMSTGLMGGSISGVSLFAGLSSDELSLFGGNSNTVENLIPYYTNSLISTNTGFADFTRNIYPIVYSSNAAIEGLTQSKALTPIVKQQLLGEAKFIRAFCYFYLINLYGETPLAVSTDYKINTLLAKSKKEVVYKQIIQDLEDAKELLRWEYVEANGYSTTNSTRRVRPNKGAVLALLARTYLFAGDNLEAENTATELINHVSTYSLSDVGLNSAFRIDSREIVWQLASVLDGRYMNTEEAVLFILPSSGPTLDISNPVFLSDDLSNSFEKGDQRKSNWIDSVKVSGNTFRYANKYKAGINATAVSEYRVVLRLAETFLIRAESRARTSNVLGAQSDLNIVRHRAGLGDTPANTEATLLDAILQERRVELFTEWGHRWLDMKRFRVVDQIMSKVTPIKGGVWSSNWQYYPFHEEDIQKDPNLVQNEGY